jgi:hypothetical protein
MSICVKKFLIPLFLAALTFSYLALPGSSAAQNSPSESAWNMQYVGEVHQDGQVDTMHYSVLAPWPDTDSQYLYSGCKGGPSPGDAQCFMTISLKDPKNPVRGATIYLYDRETSPEPPLSHPVWKSPELALLPVKVPCDTFKDPEVLAGTKRPACWDPGWNTHSHYVSEGPGKILAVNEERWRTNTQANYHGVKFYDISDPAHPVFLSHFEVPASDPVNGRYPDSGGVHHFNFKNQGQPGYMSDKNNRYLFIGSEYKGYIDKILVIIDARDPKHPVEAATWHIPGQKTPEEDAMRDWVPQRDFSQPVRLAVGTDKLKRSVGLHYPSVYGNIAYLSYHQAGLVILDVKDLKNPKFLSRLDYTAPGFKDPTMPESMKQFHLETTGYGNAHSAKLVPGHPNLLWLSDEYFTCPYGHLRMVDVADPKKPRIISHFLYPENTACDTTAPELTPKPAKLPVGGPSTHMGNARPDGLLFMAWYGMCARAIDIKDPVHPKEAGYYTYQIDPKNPAKAGCDAYDITLGPEGLLYVSDADSGLRVVKYTETGHPAGAKP